MAEREYKTEELALVGWLHSNGIICERMERSNGGCRWVFTRSARLDGAVIDFEGGSARVEPRAFALCLGTVRKEMYRFLKVQPRSVRH